MANRKYMSILVIIVAIAMILSSAVFLFPGGSQTAASDTHTTSVQANALSQSTTTSSAALSQKGASTLQSLHSKGIPNKDIYMPNFNAAPLKVGNLVNGPNYTSAPAPMGIGTYGFSNNSGVITRNNISTSSFEGSVTFNNLSTFYAYDDGPNSVTVQLNSILSNVTLFGKSTYTFWNQNVLFYSARTHQVTFLDNIWNFSSPAFYMSPNVFASYDGNLVAPYFYYTVGPTINVTYPFTVQLYLNSTVVNGNTAVFFNYTLTDANGVNSSSYDQVQFNSAPQPRGNPHNQPAPYSAPAANYLVTSYKLTPTTFIPYDSEIMIGGPGGGSTAMIYQINASMTLKYLNGGTYANVPNAYDVGSETGETSTGAAVTWTPNAVAHLSAGPSFVYGMWNVSQTNTFDHFSGQVSPSNSFMFVSQGSTFDAPNSTWSPLTNTGGYSFSLPTGSYSASIMLADHTPVGGVMTAGAPQSFNLPLNMSTGVYTPLYAFDNSQLQYISQSGMGTPGSPYMLFNNPTQSGLLNPVFATFNDYVFPEFSGVLLHNTTSLVVIQNMPNFGVQYSSNQVYVLYHYFGVVYSTNQLGYVLYGTQFATISNNFISGWFANSLTEFPVGNVLLWSSQYNTVSNNYFNTMDSSLFIYNQQNSTGSNYIYSNQFWQDSSLNKYNYPGIAVSTTFGTSPYGPVAISVYSSGNYITNNLVVVYDTAVNPFYSIYTGKVLVNFYHDYWNGNFWWNFIPSPAKLPYNNNGQIFLGGDYTPLYAPSYSPAYFTPLVKDFTSA